MPEFFNRVQPCIQLPPLRIPQYEGYQELQNHFRDPMAESEVAVILPVGCGKSGLISIAPFAIRAHRVLVVAPYVKLAEQLYETFDPTQGEKCFYVAHSILEGSSFPEPVPIRGASTNLTDLEEADVAITNIDQLQGEDNRWLDALPADFFDLILFDEGHHAVARSWEVLKLTFPQARVVNLSATPRRADGQLMPGKVVFSYPVREAIAQGYVKRLRALVLNPESLRYVREEDGEEVEVSLDEVRRLGEEDSSFRRGIVSSKESLSTIVDASVQELRRIRHETGDKRHKIIASALNYHHCHQVVAAFRARSLKADYVHSRENAPSNERVLRKLENHELDVIVQVRKLGEGFDHPYLSVAAVCSIFANLSPFVQFVGRIMRTLDNENVDSPMNQGTVVFHAGANVAQRWKDFREFSEADQEFFDELLPLEGLDFSNAEELRIEPEVPRRRELVEVRKQSSVMVQEVPLLENPTARQALAVLQIEGYTAEEVRRAIEHQAVPLTRVRQRQADRRMLDAQVRRLTGELLALHNMNQEGCELDSNRIGRTNFVIVKARIDKLIREQVADKDRSEFSQSELDEGSRPVKWCTKRSPDPGGLHHAIFLSSSSSWSSVLVSIAAGGGGAVSCGSRDSRLM